MQYSRYRRHNSQQIIRPRKDQVSPNPTIQATCKMEQARDRRHIWFEHDHVCCGVLKRKRPLGPDIALIIMPTLQPDNIPPPIHRRP